MKLEVLKTTPAPKSQNMVLDLVASGLATDALTLLGINVTLWIASLFLGKTWPVDFVWSGWPPIMCLLILLRSSFAGNRHRQLVVCVLVSLWGYRLTHNFVARGGIGHEDWRYADMRAQFGKHFWWISFFSVFLGQTIFLFGGCLTLYGALLNTSPLSPTDAIAATVAALSILLEAAADLQMDAFQSARREKRTDAVVIDRGLWLWSRHPNYLGEICWWWGLYLFGASAAPTWVCAGPIAMTLLFVGITIQLMEDRQIKNKPQAFAEYKRRVPSALLLVPPPVNRAIGDWLYRASVPAMR